MLRSRNPAVRPSSAHPYGSSREQAAIGLVVVRARPFLNIVIAWHILENVNPEITNPWAVDRGYHFSRWHHSLGGDPPIDEPGLTWGIGKGGAKNVYNLKQLQHAFSKSSWMVLGPKVGLQESEVLHTHSQGSKLSMRYPKDSGRCHLRYDWSLAALDELWCSLEAQAPLQHELLRSEQKWKWPRITSDLRFWHGLSQSHSVSQDVLPKITCGITNMAMENLMRNHPC